MTGAYLRFEDEAGQTLRPPKARTWARRHTLVTLVSGKGSSRVPVAGMTCCQPGARSRFFYRARIHTGRKGERRSMSEADYAGLIAAAQSGRLHVSADHGGTVWIGGRTVTYIQGEMEEPVRGRDST